MDDHQSYYEDDPSLGPYPALKFNIQEVAKYFKDKTEGMDPDLSLNCWPEQVKEQIVWLEFSRERNDVRNELHKISRQELLQLVEEPLGVKLLPQVADFMLTAITTIWGV